MSCVPLLYFLSKYVAYCSLLLVVEENVRSDIGSDIFDMMDEADLIVHRVLEESEDMPPGQDSSSRSEIPRSFSTDDEKISMEHTSEPVSEQQTTLIDPSEVRIEQDTSALSEIIPSDEDRSSIPVIEGLGLPAQTTKVFVFPCLFLSSFFPRDCKTFRTVLIFLVLSPLGVFREFSLISLILELMRVVPSSVHGFRFLVFSNCCSGL